MQATHGKEGKGQVARSLLVHFVGLMRADHAHSSLFLHRVYGSISLTRVGGKLGSLVGEHEGVWKFALRLAP